MAKNALFLAAKPITTIERGAVKIPRRGKKRFQCSDFHNQKRNWQDG